MTPGTSCVKLVWEDPKMGICMQEQRKHHWTDEEIELECSCNKGLREPTESSRIVMVLRCCLEPSELGLCTACLNSHWHGLLFMEVEDNSWRVT